MVRTSGAFRPLSVIAGMAAIILIAVLSVLAYLKNPKTSIDRARAIDTTLTNALAGRATELRGDAGALILEVPAHRDDVTRALSAARTLPSIANSSVMADQQAFYADLVTYAGRREPMSLAALALANAQQVATIAKARADGDSSVSDTMVTTLTSGIVSLQDEWKNVSFDQLKHESADCSFETIEALVKSRPTTSSAEAPSGVAPATITAADQCSLSDTDGYLALALSGSLSLDQLKEAFQKDQTFVSSLASDVTGLLADSLSVLKPGSDGAELQTKVDALEKKLMGSLLVNATDADATLLTNRWIRLKEALQ